MVTTEIIKWSKYFLELPQRNVTENAARKRYQEKIVLARLSEDPYCRLEIKGKSSTSIPSLEWLNWPDVTWADIYNYLILTPGVTHEQLKAYKSLDGYNFYVNGKVSNIIVTEIPGTKNYLYTALVKHSQTLSVPPLKVWVVVNDNGVVISAHCTCMAGMGEACAHVGAVLFTAEANTKAKHQMSSTSLPCAWLPCNYQFVPAMKISSIDFSTPRAKRKAVVVHNEGTSKAITSEPEIKMLPPCTEKKMKLYTRLSETEGNPIVLSHTTEFSDRHVPINKMTGFPKPLTELYDNDSAKMSHEDLLIKCTDVFDSYVLTCDEANLVESHTKDQSKSRIWFQQRAGRVTASKLKSAISTNLSNPSTSLIKSICYPDKCQFFSTACKYGCDHEEKARKEYTYTMASQHTQFYLSQSRLIIHPLHPFMGATPDGIVNCSCCGTGVVEVKCPFSCAEKSLESVAIDNSNFFCERMMKAP